MRSGPFSISIILICLQTGYLSGQSGSGIVFPGANNLTPSRSEYESWINNTNEGSTEQQILVNLEFFRWLHDEYGINLDIYVISAGAIDKAGWYGTIVIRTDSNYTYYIPLTDDMKGSKIDAVVLVMNRGYLEFKPEVWITAYPIPYEKKEIILK